MSLLGKEIKMKRVAKKITQKGMATTLGISPQSLSNIESGRALLTPTNVKAVSKLLRIKQERLVDLIVQDYKTGFTDQMKAPKSVK